MQSVVSDAAGTAMLATTTSDATNVSSCFPAAVHSGWRILRLRKSSDLDSCSTSRSERSTPSQRFWKSPWSSFRSILRDGSRLISFLSIRKMAPQQPLWRATRKPDFTRRVGALGELERHPRAKEWKILSHSEEQKVPAEETKTEKTKGLRSPARVEAI